MCRIEAGPEGQLEGAGSQKSPATETKAAKRSPRKQAAYQTIEPPCEKPDAHSRCLLTGNRSSTSSTTARMKANSSRKWPGEPGNDHVCPAPSGATSKIPRSDITRAIASSRMTSPADCIQP